MDSDKDSVRFSRRGFTLVELMVSVAVLAILAAIAVPAYSRYINTSRARGAASDLVALSLVLENDLQKNALMYPAYGAGTVIPARQADRAGTMAQDFTGWAPAEGAYFTYTLSSTSTTYTVTATAQNNLRCSLTLTHENVRTATGNDCGFTRW